MATVHVEPSVTEEVLEFLTASPTLQQIIEFHPSEELQQRLEYLLDKNSSDKLTTAEEKELQEALQMNHFVKMLKIKARKKLAGL